MKNYGLDIYIYGGRGPNITSNYIGGIGFQEWDRYKENHLFISERYNNITKNIHRLENILNEGTL